MADLEHVEKLWQRHLDGYTDESMHLMTDIARKALEERDGYKAQLVETLKAHNENGEVLARLQRRLEEAERVIEPLVCERDRLKWELDNAGVTNIEDGTAETWDTIPDNYYQDPRITKSQLEAAAAWLGDKQDGS